MSTGIPEGLQQATFESFNLTLNLGLKPAYDRCLEVAKGLAWCAVLMGKPGRGKSHLAVAALKERCGCFWEVPALLRNIRHLAFDDRGPNVPEEEVLKPWEEGNFLLVLDDLGAEKLTDWANQTLYSILNSCYLLKLPTIITTNNPDAVDERILSRYYTGVIQCPGVDMRRKVYGLTV